jgi:hypothetical protein
VTLFSDVTAASTISFSHVMAVPGGLPLGPQRDIAASTFGGVAAGDCEGDGDTDLFVTYSDQRPNRLYVNQRFPVGGFSFADLAATSGTGLGFTRAANQNWRHSGPVFVDLDGDGALDIFLGALFDDPVKVFRNTGSCTFTEDSPGAELDNLLALTTFSAGFGDYDLDGDLDMILSHWGTPDSVYAGAGGRQTVSEMLWRNDSTPGNIAFVNISQPSGVTAISYEPRSWYEPGAPATARCQRFVPTNTVPEAQDYDYVFTGTFARLNNDAWPDLLLVGDYTTSQVLINNGDGTFRDGSTAPLCQAQQPMGSALGDYDFDGDLDWFTTSIRFSFANGSPVPGAIGNRFYRNIQDGMGSFGVEDVTDELAVSAGGWGWGACLLDIDNDTDLDIFHTNGWAATQADGGVLVQDFNIDPSRAFIYNGTSFSEQSASYGLNDTRSGRGVVCADFDEDGDLDIFQTSHAQPNSGLMRENRTAAAGRNFLKVKLRGLPPNTEAVGARIYVTITAGGKTQMREIIVGSDNYTSQNPTVQHFGLGTAANVQQLRIVWPWRNSAQQSPDTILQTVSANQTLSCNQANAPNC